MTYGPWLVGSLLVGMSLVKGMSFRSGVPFVGVNHLEAHLLAIHLEHDVAFPYIALLASGGHTLLYYVKDVGRYIHLGGTRDDAAGEAFDKVAKMMGLGYPGGRSIDNLAQTGNPKAVRFPRARLKNAPLSLVSAVSKPRRGIISKSRGRTSGNRARPISPPVPGGGSRYVGQYRPSEPPQSTARHASSCRAGLPPIAAAPKMTK